MLVARFKMFHFLMSCDQIFDRLVAQPVYNITRKQSMATATTTKTTKKTTAKKATKKRATPKKNLVIVESPAKAKTIEKYLGRNYKVVASVGHILDLKKSSMSIDFKNN